MGEKFENYIADKGSEYVKNLKTWQEKDKLPNWKMGKVVPVVWRFVSLQNSYVEILTHKVVVLGRTFGRALPSWMRLVPLYKKP